MPEPMTLAAALAIFAGAGRVRFPRAPVEHQALKVIRDELDVRAARIAELEARPSWVPAPDDGDQESW
jgi:hypothetical protein